MRVIVHQLSAPPPPSLKCHPGYATDVGTDAGLQSVRREKVGKRNTGQRSQRTVTAQAIVERGHYRMKHLCQHIIITVQTAVQTAIQHAPYLFVSVRVARLPAKPTFTMTPVLTAY